MKTPTVVRKTYLGNSIKAGRKLAGLTQRQLATDLNYTSPQYISNIERGVCEPSLPQLILIYEKLDMLILLESHYSSYKQEQLNVTVASIKVYTKRRLTNV